MWGPITGIVIPDHRLAGGRGVQSLEIQLLTTGWQKTVGSKTGDTETVPKITVYPQ